MFSCEFCELYKKTYFVEHLRTAGSETPVWGSLFNGKPDGLKAFNSISKRP